MSGINTGQSDAGVVQTRSSRLELGKSINNGTKSVAEDSGIDSNGSISGLYGEKHD